ncbi:uncharacterized protein [Spinacia oleracea]|uniref:CCHC-type domain-containing protein n=1 Tax=Spinacia oleracea TaxID=3562 RepID=A0ABM3R3P5_SPIOL|nr:uncharacterized protein LOC110801663 [Spinacia oleracea]
MTSHWIAEHYQNLFKVNLYMRVQDIQETIWLEKGIRVSKDKAARARRRGQALIVGEYKEQYALLPRYAAEILRSNPGNTMKLKLDANVFDRLYLCFEALRKGSLAGCRPFISLDGCFLKGPFGGQFVDNNMSEVFNAYILSARHKPIITMLEDIREGLMDRLHKKRDFIGKKEITLCPRIQILLEKHKIWARGWNAYWDGGFCYGVREGATQVKYVVDLNQHTCSCNAWQTYMKAYEFLLEPLNGPQEWPTSDSIVVAPKVKKVNGRPKTKRRYGVGEVTASGKLKRTGCAMKCILCGVIGHNKKGCKNAPKQQQHSNNYATAEQTTPHQQHPRTSSAIPMHNRGVGIYTYPNGYQRIATVSHSIDSNSFLHVTLLY